MFISLRERINTLLIRIMNKLRILMHIILVLLVGFVSHGQPKTMDENIAGAMVDANAMDFMQDDGTVLVELDMKFSAEDWAIIQEMKDADMEVNSRKKRKAIRFEHRRWTNKVVPYFLSNVFSSRDQAQIMAAIADWERYTCLDFRPYRNGDRNYILIQNGGGCSSFVGMQGGSQAVSLAPGCRSKGIIVHELGHAIGFQHEQTRPDRDSFVTVYYQNIIRGTEFNFQKYSTNTVNNFGVPYDYTSVMHYGGTAFSSNGQYTIRTRDPANQRLIGNRYGHSFRDIKMANIMYQCSASCPSRSCPGEGFVGKDCQCWCPGNPVQVCQGGGGGLTTTARPPTATTTSPGEGDCEDNHRHCESWASSGECEKNPAYMHTNCKKSCKICTDGGGGGGGGGGGSCTDNNVNCESWASSGECQRNPAYMMAYCKKSCKVCNGGGGGGGNGPCVDTNTYCTYWASVGYCNSASYREYMKMSCRKACGHCSGGK